MLKNIVIFTLFLSSVLMTSLSMAADLTNEDGVAYTLYVETDAGATSRIIEAGATIVSICSDCYIEIDETGNGLSIDQEVNIVIKDGKIMFSEE